MKQPSEDRLSFSEVTWLDIIDVLRAKMINWQGRLEEIEFLSRLYDLQKLPATRPAI